jgi:DNA segregation ATPase FtsK/SpoIIIE, S-DNA-T family
MPTKKPPARKKPAPRRARHSAPRVHLPTLQQRQLDLIGLGLVALALFFAFLVYFGWDGGRAGSEAVEGLRWLLGAAHYLVPVALAAGGAILMLRPVLPAVRPFRSGAICVFVAVTLGLSAGTLGVGPGGMRPEWWDAQWVKTRGGMTGETLDWVVTTLAGTVGAHILAVFLFIAGVLLLTGASVAGVIKATSDSVSTTTRELRTAVASKRPRAMDDLATLERSTRVRVERPEIFGETPEFEPPAKPKRAPKKKAAKAEEDESFWSGEERFPDLYGAEGPPPEVVPEEAAPEPVAELSRLAEDPAEDEPGVTRGPSEPVAQEQLTPQGRYRKDVTDSPDFIWELPDASKLTRSTEEASRPDTAGQEKVAAQLIEALGHFNVEARVIGMVAGPHITRYELRLAPGIKVGKVA